MPNWTRAHDAHIARECEGWKLVTEGVMVGGWQTPCSRHEYAPARYTENANARDRAAEAWRLKEECRWYTTESAANGMGGGALWPRAKCLDNHSVIGEHCGEHALLWALWKATGGKE